MGLDEEQSIRDRWEASFAEAAAACIAAIRSGGPDAFPPSPGSMFQLEWFAADALTHHAGWRDGWWNDGFLADAAAAPSERRLVVRGRLWWVDAIGEGAGWWIDPVLIAVDLSATLTQIDFYEVAFGDAKKGVGKVPSLESSATEWSDLTQWLLTVRGSGYPEPIDRSGGERIKCSMECLIARMKSRTADTPLTHIDSCPMYGEDPQRSSTFRRFEA